MSKNKDRETIELNDKNKETKDLFAGLKQYKKKNKESIREDIDENIEEYDSDKVNNSENIYMSLLDDNESKEEYVAATHYFRRDQLKELDKFAKKTKKLKSEFMRELMDLVFVELTRGLNENKRKSITTVETTLEARTVNKCNSNNKTALSDSPFASLLEVNDGKDQYVRASHYFRQDQLDDLDRFVEKSGKSKNEFIRDTMDLVFSQLKEIDS